MIYLDKRKVNIMNTKQYTWKFEPKYKNSLIPFFRNKKNVP